MKTTVDEGKTKTVTEKHSYTYGKGCVDRTGLKTLTAALKELHDLTDDGDGGTVITVSLTDAAEEAAR